MGSTFAHLAHVLPVLSAAELESLKHGFDSARERLIAHVARPALVPRGSLAECHDGKHSPFNSAM